MRSACLYFALIFSMGCSSIFAAYTLQDGRLVDAKTIATMSAVDHYNAGVTAYQDGDWAEAARQFIIVSSSYPKSTYAQNALFYLGISEYNQGELDFSNDAFSAYMKSKNNPQNFQEAIEYKFAIAKQLGGGTRTHVLGKRKLPKWSCGKELALKIYEEVIAALPCHDLAAKALYEKGNLQWSLSDFRGSVESFGMLIKRFPKSELAPESYVTISKVYVEQSAYEYQNPDVLAFAEINLRRFKQDFPREERLKEVQEDVLAIKEIYAKGLYETGQFYERTKKSMASLIYYQKAIKQFPETQVADLCRYRLKVLNPSSAERLSPKADELDPEIPAIKFSK